MLCLVWISHATLCSATEVYSLTSHRFIGTLAVRNSRMQRAHVADGKRTKNYLYSIIEWTQQNIYSYCWSESRHEFTCFVVVDLVCVCFGSVCGAAAVVWHFIDLFPCMVVTHTLVRYCIFTSNGKSPVTLINIRTVSTSAIEINMCIPN